MSEIALNDLKSHNDSRFIACLSAWLEIYQYVYPSFRMICKSIKASEFSQILAEKYISEVGEKQRQEDIKQLENISEWLPGAIELFLRHTYLATIVKVLVTATQAPDRASFYKMIKENPESIIDGTELTKNNIYIIEKDDFFSWITSDRKTLTEMLRFIANKFSRLKFEFREDVFRRIYEEIIDEVTRHQLGEYYTPRWMAEYLAKLCIKDKDQKVLDPACGSGTFLVAAIRRKYQLGQKDLNKLLEDVWGIDINPLSVLIAKAVVYLTIFGLEERGPLPHKISPNIYVGDSLANYRVEAEKIRESLKEDIREETEIFVKISENIILRARKPPDNLTLHEKVRYLKNAIKSIEKVTEDEYSKRLKEQIRQLQKIYGNNVWITILNNHLIIPLLENEFDVIIGNPPWLVYREAGKLQHIIDYVVEKFDINPPPRSKTSLNLAFIFMIASMRFLKKEGEKVRGILGFVVPPSITELAHYRLLYALIKRKDGVNGMKLRRLEDFSDLKEPPFPHGLGASIIVVEGEEK